MKIVLIANQFPKFSETFIVTKFLGLLDLGYDVHVVCNRSDPDQWGLYAHLVERADIRSRVRICPERKLVTQALREIEPDIVHFEFGGLTKNRMDLPELVGARTVVSFRGPDLNVGWMDDPDLYAPVWSKADGFHFLGRDLQQRAEALGCPVKPTALVPPAVDTRFFDGRRPPHVDVAGGPDRPLRILSVGRLHWMKGYEYALRAVRTLVDQNISCEYTIIGAHDHREHLLAVRFDITDLGLEGVVRLAGRQSREEVRRAMASADVLVHAAVSEGFCNAVVEAQAMRLPVVVSDAGGLPDNVAHRETGFVTPRRSPRAVSDRLSALAADPGLRERLATAGRARALDHFSLDGYASKFQTLYRDVLLAAPGSSDDLRNRLAEKERRVRVLERQLPQPLLEALRASHRNDSVRDIDAVVPDDAVVAVVSRGDESLLRATQRRAQHFPASDDGVYAGHHPGTADEAIDLVEKARCNGAEYLAFPKTSLWWLEHYVALTDHLTRTYADESRDPAVCRIFRLHNSAERAVEHVSQR